MLKVKIECFQCNPPKPLRDIGNGEFFTGSIAIGANATKSLGPWLKIGSITMDTWVVACLERMEGGVFVSRRDDDAVVLNYQPLNVREVVLRSHESPESAAAVDPVSRVTTG